MIINPRRRKGNYYSVSREDNAVQQPENKKEISKEINADIAKGIYDNYPVLKDRLEYLAHKLVLAVYIENTILSRGEMETLKENDYL